MRTIFLLFTTGLFIACRTAIVLPPDLVDGGLVDFASVDAKSCGRKGACSPGPITRWFAICEDGMNVWIETSSGERIDCPNGQCGDLGKNWCDGGP